MKTILEEMLRVATKTAKKARAKMGIGGGIAVGAHGYRRYTQDVDAFFHFDDRRKVLAALRSVAPDYKIESLHDSHWIAIPPNAETDERIDLLFATGDPEESAIEMSKPQTVQHVSAPVFPIDMLIVTKYLASRDDAKDWLDIYALHQRGAFEISQVVKRLKQMGLTTDATEFVPFMERLKNLKKRDEKGNKK
jgi:hypothetical protein